MRLPKLTSGGELFSGAAGSSSAALPGVQAQHGAPQTAAAARGAVSPAYTGECCMQDPATGKFLDCCYGPCRVVDSC